MKPWYIAPLNLKPLANETIGLIFSEDKTEQLAIQTSKEIWIDSKKFEKMSTKEQATLIMHEYLMSLYFLKFYKISELCDQQRGITGIDNCKIDFEAADEFLPAEKLRPLSDQDYPNIRNATNWFIQNGASAKFESINEYLLGTGFDPRFFSQQRQQDDDKKPLQLKDYSPKDMFKKFNLTGDKKAECSFLTLNKDQSCQINLTDIKKQINDFPMDVVKIDLSTDDKTIFSTDILSGKFSSSGVQPIFSSTDLKNKKNVYALGLADIGIFSSSNTVGKKIQLISLFVTVSPLTAAFNTQDKGLTDPERLQIVGMSVTSYVITGIKEDVPGAKKCIYTKTQADSEANDAFLLTTEPRTREQIKNYAKYLNTKLTEYSSDCR
jgi:hypothetical protein